MLKEGSNLNILCVLGKYLGLGKKSIKIVILGWFYC